MGGCVFQHDVISYFAFLAVGKYLVHESSGKIPNDEILSNLNSSKFLFLCITIEYKEEVAFNRNRSIYQKCGASLSKM